ADGGGRDSSSADGVSIAAGVGADSVYVASSDATDAETKFALIGLSPQDNPHTNKDLGIVDSGCSKSMTGNKEKLADFVKIKGGTVTFGGGDDKITGKGTIKTSNFNFENVYYVEELQNFNLFSVSQICDIKNKVLFTDKECLVLSKEFSNYLIQVRLSSEFQGDTISTASI
ncbi:hypothetical protein Tco_1413691, partial [Tanacetum coccineum]